jgi:hypothetical protein
LIANPYLAANPYLTVRAHSLDFIAGQFYGGDSYVLKYTYMQGRKECYIVYFWLGKRRASHDTASWHVAS